MQRLENWLFAAAMLSVLLPAAGTESLRCTTECSKTHLRSGDSRDATKWPHEECRWRMRFIECLRACPGGKERDLLVREYDSSVTPMCSTNSSQEVARGFFEEVDAQFDYRQRLFGEECGGDINLLLGVYEKPDGFCSDLHNCLGPCLLRGLANASTPVARLIHASTSYQLLTMYGRKFGWDDGDVPYRCSLFSFDNSAPKRPRHSRRRKP
ncbi:hypothetical protein AAVH_20822 [Aphelenchoides avenae]|nr:hypothetical protein AAVH_20822 [Aphelenchus avenae]